LTSYDKETLTGWHMSRPLEVAWNLLVLLRPKHWVKNFFVFAPLLFSGHFRNLDDIHAAALSFAVFCMVASAIYTFNDVVDRERDALSETNRHRPVASGKIIPGLAAACGMVLLAAALSIAWRAKPALLFFASLYLANNLLYTLYIKDKVIADVISIAAGFVIRVLAGAAVIAVEASQWLLVCTFSVSLLLGFGKRAISWRRHKSRQRHLYRREARPYDQCVGGDDAGVLFALRRVAGKRRALARPGDGLHGAVCGVRDFSLCGENSGRQMQGSGSFDLLG
jgi:4-hydroxybenzoate polyprenyltransferase